MKTYLKENFTKMEKLEKTSTVVIAISVIILVIFLAKLFGIGINPMDSMDPDTTAKVGDFVGGVIGTIFTGGAFYFLLLTFNEQKKELEEQRKEFKKDRFENNFFEMIKLHRENVSELKYEKYINEKEIDTCENRKVFKEIFYEFIECQREVEKFLKLYKDENILNENYKRKLKVVVDKHKANIDLDEMAKIDMAYSIVYFGVGEEGAAILRKRFLKRYNNVFVCRLIDFIRLKPRKSCSNEFKRWGELFDKEKEILFETFNEIYTDGENGQVRDYVGRNVSLIVSILKNYECIKYYGGHQHRLGHYFRHLFQSYTYLESADLPPEEQKFYGKTLRGQLSTYEQALLFLNSVSTLGLKWEIGAEKNPLITKYQLIKNLTNGRLYNISYYDYYPKVEFEERDEDAVFF
jgi:hypothetical protein